MSRFTALKSIFLILTALVALSTVALRTWIARRLCRVDLEFFFVVLGTVGLAVSNFGSRWYSAQLLGRDPHQVFGNDVGSSEVNVVMIVNLVTIAGCSAVPLRSHLQCVLAMVGIIIFCAATFAASSPYPQNVPLLLYLLCCSSGLSLLGGFRKDSHLRKEWLAQRQIEKQSSISEKQKQGFLHLLNSFCDCLVHLGPNLEIIEPCPNLAAMLFLIDGKALEGSHFCDFIACEEDRDLFRVAMGNETSGDELAGIVPLHLRDSQSREVQVHVYHTSFYDRDDSRYHIIGIAEAGAWRDVAEPVEEMGLQHRGSTTMERASSVSAGSGTEASESKTTLEPVAGSDLGEISVTFDDTAGCTILRCTPGFTGLCGPIDDGAKLVGWMRDEKKFREDVEECANTFYSLQHEFRPLVLRPPNAVRAGIEYVINKCTLDAISSVHDDDPSNQRFALRVRFDDVQQRALRRRARRKRQAVRVSRSLPSRSETRLFKL